MCILCALGMMLPTFGCDEDDAPEQPAPKPPTEPEQPEQPEQPEAGTYIVVAPATLITSESGTTLRGSLALDKAPESHVVVTLVSSDMTEGTVEPQTLTFDGQNYATPQYFSITGQPDGIIDGDITYTVTATATTDDTSFSSGTVFSWTIINRDIDGAKPDPKPIEGTHIRFMAANITSDAKGYDPDAGRNIFKAVKPDIAMIQEFKLSKQKPEAFFAEIFGPEFHYFVGSYDDKSVSKTSPG